TGGQSFALGVALASVGQYSKAETFFSRTLETEPENFEALYDLGLAASHAGHHDRAHDVLQQALERQPQNVDVLYDLAAVDFTLDRKESALELLARASKISPGRADVLQLLARISADLGYFADAIQAWNEYLKTAPNDDTARRERAFAETAIGENAQAGLNELNSFVRKHPNDPLGHYELGVAQAPQHPDLALQEFERALAAKPDLLAAHIARGLLLYRQGKPEAALADFQFAVRRDPKNGTLLDRLGETYLALDRANDALPVLGQAAELMPSNSTVLLHLGRALAKTGHTEEANAVFARCRELGPDKSASPHPAGLVEFLSLSPAEQAAKYRAGVERTVRSNPANVEAQVRYLSILLEEGKIAEATSVAHSIASLHPTAPSLEQAARATLAAEQYRAAQELLQSNEVSSHGSPDLSLDRAIADFYAVNAKAGLYEMDRIPQNERNGDYYLARVQMLAAQNQWQDAKLVLQEALRANPTRPELYHQTAVLLIKNQHAAEALQLLDRAVRNLSDNPDTLLLRAITLALTGNGSGAGLELKKLEMRWPDWYKVWLVGALVLESQGRSEEARPLRQTAITLGAPADINNLIDALMILFH
ncbi:MAG: tetratricopeptide repeat protein, partial [Acidobacteriaceae bacterium]|nr:tetratricopeptide repeat protein [Acidobacteriaceae bacterium]